MVVLAFDLIFVAVAMTVAAVVVRRLRRGAVQPPARRLHPSAWSRGVTEASDAEDWPLPGLSCSEFLASEFRASEFAPADAGPVTRRRGDERLRTPVEIEATLFAAAAARGDFDAAEEAARTAFRLARHGGWPGSTPSPGSRRG